MHLARPLFDAEGRLVAGTGTVLTERVVRVLRKMAVQSVLVVADDRVATWETVQPLAADLAALDARFARAPSNPALSEVHAAIARHLTRRAERFAAEDAAPEVGEDDRG